MSISIRKALPLLAALLLSLLGAGVKPAHATPIAAWVTIFDGFAAETDPPIMSSLNDTGYIDPTITAVIAGGFVGQPGTINIINTELTPLGPLPFGVVDMRFDYADPTPLPNGTTRVVNFNIYDFSTEPPPGNPSDTLSFTFTGHLDGANNMSVDLHFLSDGTLSPPPLAGGIVLNELGSYQDVSAQIRAATGLSQFNARFTSDASVPEPASLTLLGVGLCGLVGRRWRQVKAKTQS